MKQFIDSIDIRPAVLPLVVLLLWQAGSWFNLFPETILPGPKAVILALLDSITSGELISNLGVTFGRTITGLAIGVAAGFAMGVLTASVPLLDALLSPLIIAFRQIPMFAWIPMIILVFGIEEASKVVFISIGTFYPMIINTYDGIKTVPEKYNELAAAYEYNPFEKFIKVTLPCAAPGVITGLRFAISMSWMLVVGAEILGAESGIGFLMSWSRQMFQADKVFAFVAVIGVIGIALNHLLATAEKKLMKWKGSAHGTGI